MEVLPGYTVGQIVEAFWTTIQLTVYSGIGALVLGTVLAAMRLAPVPMLNWLGTAYVNVVRNTPLTLIILFCSFGLAQTLGLTLATRQSPTFIADSGFRLAVLCLTVYTASFVCETVRSGVKWDGSNCFLPDCTMMKPITMTTAPTSRAAAQGVRYWERK